MLRWQSTHETKVLWDVKNLQNVLVQNMFCNEIHRKKIQKSKGMEVWDFPLFLISESSVERIIVLLLKFHHSSWFTVLFLGLYSYCTVRNRWEHVSKIMKTTTNKNSVLLLGCLLISLSIQTALHSSSSQHSGQRCVLGKANNVSRISLWEQPMKQGKLANHSAFFS